MSRHETRAMQLVLAGICLIVDFNTVCSSNNISKRFFIVGLFGQTVEARIKLSEAYIISRTSFVTTANKSKKGAFRIFSDTKQLPGLLTRVPAGRSTDLIHIRAPLSERRSHEVGSVLGRCSSASPSVCLH